MQALSAKNTAPRSFAHLAARFASGRGGSAAIEFAMVALPFLMLICGILEISMIYLVSTTLENATADVARQIRTGQLQTAGGATAATFVSSICGELSWLGSKCSSNLYVDVRTFASFSSVNQPSPIQNGQLNQNNLTFTPGSAGDIVLVRAFYQWKLFSPLIDQMSASLNGGSTMITATAAFKNEPYGTSGS
jgi:Flp pilus assembly protein TadG